MKLPCHLCQRLRGRHAPVIGAGRVIALASAAAWAQAWAHAWAEVWLAA